MRLTVIAAAAALLVAPALAEDRYLTKQSPYSVNETVERLESAIEEGGASVVATVDHSGAAERAGMALPPTKLVIFGNPKMGTPLIQEARSMALFLPLRIAVWEEEDGGVVVAYQDVQELAQAQGVRDGLETVEEVVRRLEALTDKVVRPE